MKRIAFLALLCAALPAWAADWKVDPADSRLGFIGTQQDGKFEGHFRDWRAVIRFDPAQPAQGLFDVVVETGSITTGSKERDQYLPSKDWFFVKQFPQATFRTTSFAARGGNRYVAQGKLTIRGVTQDISLPFTWTGNGDTAHMSAETTVDRNAFGIGQGDFADAEVVGRQVKVVVELSLKR